MSYQEDKQGKFRRQTSRQAIGLAMEGRWEESVEINKGILKNFPNDVDAHNRLGKAYLELGQYALAKEAYEKAAQLDQYNTIARKNLERLALLSDKAPAPREGSSEKVEPHLFIEEIGKAGVVNLYQIAPSETLVKMLAGDKVILKPQNSSLAVENIKGEYLGLVPAKHAQRLVKLMDGGNKYTAAIVSSNETSISVIIRETYQDPSQIGHVSFPGKRLEEVQPFVSDRVFRPGDEEEIMDTPFIEDSLEAPEGAVEEVEEEKEWEQEA
jgi:hypothetical protein